MKITIENKLDKNSELYNAFSQITAEKFAEFYAKIVSKDVLDEVSNLNVKINKFSLLGNPRLNIDFEPEFKQANEAQDDSFFSMAMKISHKLNNCRSFTLFNYIGTFDSRAYEEKYTALWRQFLTENLGEKFYRTLLAEYIKQSIDAKKSANEQEHKNLVAQLAKIKQKEKELSDEMANFKQEYADVLDDVKNSNGEVITSSETKTD